MTYPHDDRDPRNSDPRNDPRDPRAGGGAPNRGPAQDDGGPGPGNYPVKVVSHTIGRAGTGTHQIGCMVEITEGPHAGKAYPWYGSFTKDATPITIRGMRAFGWQGDDLEDLRTMYAQPAIGVLEVDANEDGSPRRRFSFINGAGVAMKETLTGSDLAVFAKQMRGTIARLPGGSAGGGGGAQPSARQPANGGGGDYGGGGYGGNGGRQPAPAQPQTQQRSFGGNDRGPRDPRDGVPPPSDSDAPPFERGGKLPY